MTLFTTMTLICLYYTYFGQQLEKGKLAIIHKLNMYIHNMIASCFVCKVNANLNPA